MFILLNKEVLESVQTSLIMKKRKNDIISTIKNKQLSLGGPYSLINGGRGLIGRLPVFITDNYKNTIFWGLITVTIDIDHLIDSTNLKSLEANGYYFELNRIDSDTKKTISIIKTSHKKLIDPVSIKMDLQNTEDDWYLSLSPKAGWTSSSFIYSLYILVTLFSFVVSLFIYNLISQPEILKKRIKIVTEELNSKNKLLNQAEKLSNFAKLTSAIAHEIRQPLNSIKILTDGVIFWDNEKHKTSYKELLGYFSNISANVDKIDEIIKSLKLMINAPDKIETKPININDEIKNLLDIFMQKASNHFINISLELDSKLKEIIFSEPQFQQVMINLLDNAINSLDKIEKNDKMIQIKTADEDNFIKISVIDNGTGICEEIIDRIFEPFFTTGKDSDSMGMGLYVIKNILTNFNSEISAKSNEYRGATFEIILKR